MKPSVSPPVRSAPNQSATTARLAYGLRHRLTLIRVADNALSAACSDAAGEGRSPVPGSDDAGSCAVESLLQWARSADVRLGILHLTSTDHQPECFVAHLEDAVARALGAGAPAGGTPEERLVDLINRLEALPRDLMLVLVSAGLDLSPATQELLELLIDYAPPSLHLYVMTAGPVALTNVARLRARRQVLEIDWRPVSD